MSSFRVGLFHLSDGTCIVRASLVEAVQRGDLIVVGPGKRILGLNHFNVVGHAGLKTVAGLINFIFGEFYAEIGDLHFVASGLQVQERGFDIESDLVAKVGLLLLQLLQLEIRFGDFRLDTSAVKIGTSKDAWY